MPRLAVTCLLMLAILPLPLLRAWGENQTDAPAGALATDNAYTLFENFVAQRAATLTFEQHTYDSRNTLLNETSGRLLYQRPNRFRLQYNTPEHPLVVADGSLVWTYEADLQQVIVQPFADAQKNGLFKVLTSADLTELREEYVLSAGVGGDLHWLNASADNTDNTISLIALGFAADGMLKQVVIEDHFGGRAEMNITSQNDQVADPDVFSFTPPAGTDIVYPPN